VELDVVLLKINIVRHYRIDQTFVGLEIVLNLAADV
jgi:hypothetical protein